MLFKNQQCLSCQKKIYNYDRAVKMRGLIENESGIVLRIYLCPKNQGFHLTSMRYEEFENENG